MSNTVLSWYAFSDMQLTYLADPAGHVGMMLLPLSLADKADFLTGNIESLVQLYIRGDALPGGFSSGLTLSETETTYSMTYRSQTLSQEDDCTVVTTVLENNRRHRVSHRLLFRAGTRAFEVQVRFENLSDRAVVLENLSSFSLGRLTPFGDSSATNLMKLHRARSWWSAEGRLQTETLSAMHLEPSWSLGGVRVEKFGQIGSMPVRHYFPFVAAEDPAAGVIWAAQLACPSSWQMEARRSREMLCLTGGLADFEYGHWCKTLEPGASFDAPSAYLTVCEGSLDPVSQRLLDLHQIPDRPLPVIFNEFCTTWGNPCEENIRKIARTLRGKGIDYLVIDAGWFGDGEWWDDIGDWNPSETKFPNGIGSVVRIINEAGMKAGLWYELERCTGASQVAKNTGLLLKRHGTPRNFLNMTSPEARAYLQEKVIDFLNRHGFRYIKVDYNDSIGLGCDDPDGLGEGLRKNMLASQDFFRKIRSDVPDIAIEICSSGGHRLEPSMLDLCDFASFSDAHECVHIPIIAANLHRLMQPAKSQIWAVLRKEDSLRRTNYSIVNSLLGVMCLSGDIYDLSDAQWTVVTDGIDFYRAASPVIRHGTSAIYGPEIKSYADPEGWQAVVRTNEETGQTLVVAHTFGGEFPGMIRLPVNASRICRRLSTEGNRIVLSGDTLEISLEANFEAVAVLLQK